MVTTNPRPTYSVLPALSTVTRRVLPNRFRIIEFRGSETNLICEMSNRGDRLNELLKRGIPLDDARSLFYQMDGQSGRIQEKDLRLVERDGRLHPERNYDHFVLKRLMFEAQMLPTTRGINIGQSQYDAILKHAAASNLKIHVMPCES